MGKQKTPEQLAKFLSYVLGRKPDEFGLIPDQEGYVKIKELLKALSEEEGFRHVRRAHLEEIRITLPNPPFEIKENLIRARAREHLSQMAPAQNLPGLLYTCIRKKAHAVVMEKGIFPTGHSHVILSSSREIAEKLGKRKDSSPVLLTVHVQKAIDKGVVFFQSGESLFLAEFIPIDSFTGPSLPKEKPETKKETAPKEEIHQKFPGSFFIDLTEEKEEQKGKRKKDKRSREKERKQERKQKQKKMWEIP